MPPADTPEVRPITFVIPGVPSVPGIRQDGGSRGGDPGAPPPAASGSGHVKARVRVAARRGGDAVRVTAVPGEDVVVLHIAGGPVLTLHPANAAALMRGQGGATRSAARSAVADPGTDPGSDRGPGDGNDGGEVQVSAQLRWQGLEQGAPSRSGGFLGEVLLSTFEVLTGFVRDKAVHFVASQAVHKLDGQVEAGVYELSPSGLSALKGSGRLRPTLPAPADPETEPLLVLVHGSFVDTASTFGKLWLQHPLAVRELFAHYGQRVYALDHPTLGASPIANALTLVQALPAGARLHLATHSRGGLVAEVLARVCDRPKLDADDLAHFAKPGDAQQRRDLRALALAVEKKGIKVDRVVRVACPARGTLLASGRLDAYLSVLKWTLELAAVPVAPALLDFLTEVAKRRADPAELPGLAAMIPDAPLLNWLNDAKEPIAGDLRVIAGDLQGDSVGTWLKTLLADAFYWTDNDLVVHTRSMYGGAPRQGGAQFLLDQGGKVSHFAYFANERTVQAVLAGLKQAQPAGFGTIGPLSWAGQDSSGSRAARAARAAGAAGAAGDGHPASDRPAVFVLPGILGSHLRVGDTRIWLSLRLIGNLARLRFESGRADGVQPGGLIGSSYDALIDHLAATHEVIEFSCDWRRPVEEEARRLADAVTVALDARNASGQPVRLLAHSAGGLLARTLQLERPQVWTRLMQRPGARLLMLGTPNGGSWSPMQCLSGDDTFGNALASFGSPSRDRQARQWLAEMPGFMQLQAGLLDQGLDQESTWRALADADLKFVQERNGWHTGNGGSPDAAYTWGVPPQAVLDQARALRERLDRQRDGDLAGFADRLALVVGRAKFTPDGYAIGEQGLVYQDAVDGGDGRVTLASAQLPGVRTWMLAAEHGSLPDQASAFDAYVDLLERGDTDRLGSLPMPGQRSSVTAGPAAVTHVGSRPSRARSMPLPATEERSVFVQGRVDDSGAQRPRAPALHVTVLNGNLSFVRSPLMVGHSRSLVLTGTEGAVNGLVGGVMKASLDAGLYPDEPGSHQIFMNARQDPDNPWAAPRPGAVIVAGLGDEGKLTEERLTRSVRQAVMAWAQRQAEHPGGAPVHMELAATLMGSGGSGMNASNAARAIAQGVRDANLRLSTGNDERGWPVVSQLTLVELYLERASDAWHGLQVLATAAPGDYEIAPTIASGVGPLRRQIDSGYRGTDYDFISATSARDDTIAFTLDTRRARTEVRAQSTQGRLIRELVSKASRDSRSDDGDNDGDTQLGRTLFQLLVPHEVEPFLSGTSRMLLELDDRTAPIPWELLDTQTERPTRPGQGTERPWAIRTQLLRKLRKDSYRQPVRDASPDDSVLVIGEPLTTDERYARLPGAAREARAVAAQLRETGPVGAGGADRIKALLDRPSASQVINALFERCYRIVHIAGHGEPVLRDDVDSSRLIHKGGVVLSDGTFLGPDEVRSMRTVPELVFVNCCHLAAPDDQEALKARRRGPFDRAGFAYGLADALIETGVRCVIAAGWAVDDAPAEIFATTFYAQLLNRQPFITAVARAREAAWLADPGSNTWAAYQCYGDPNWTYRQAPGDALAAAAMPRDEFESVASPLALTLALEEVVVQRRYMGERPQTQLEKVRHLDARFASLWGGMGAVAEALALGYQEGGDVDTAIAWYERAIRSNDGSASMKAQEQVGNLRARRAWDRLQAAPAAERAAAMDPARSDLAQAVRELSLLANLLPTLERHSLVGSAHKRLALLERVAGDAAAEAQQLDTARAAYRAALRMAQETMQADLFYAAMNELAIDLVLQGLQSAGRRAVLDAALLDTARRSLQAKAQRDPDFWVYAGLIEIDLFQALADRRLAGAADALLDRYADLHTRVGSRGYWESLADQGEFVLSPHTRLQGGAEAASAARLLAWLNERAGRSADAAG